MSRPLPSGRRAADAMSSDEVAADQRSRMLLAMVGAVAESGYGVVTVTHVIERAKVSRATFYEQFRDKRDCFLAAYELSGRFVRGALTLDQDRSVAEVVGTYLDTIAGNLDYARVFLIEINALGTDAMSQRLAAQKAFAQVVAAAHDAETPESLFAAEAFVAAVAMMVSLRLAAGDIDGIRALTDPLSDLATRLLGPRRGRGTTTAD